MSTAGSFGVVLRLTATIALSASRQTTRAVTATTQSCSDCLRVPRVRRTTITFDLPVRQSLHAWLPRDLLQYQLLQQALKGSADFPISLP